jgi:hypothetical protein
MDTWWEKIKKQNEEYRAKLDADPALKFRREMVEAHKCPSLDCRLKKGCMVIWGTEIRYLKEPRQYTCERCWERAQIAENKEGN